MKRIALVLVTVAAFLFAFNSVTNKYPTISHRPEKKPRLYLNIQHGTQGDFGFRKFFPNYIEDTSKFKRVWWSRYDVSKYPQTHPRFKGKPYWMRSMGFPIFQDNIGGGMFPKYPEHFVFFRDSRVVWDSAWESNNLYPYGRVGEYEDGGRVSVWKRDATTDPRYSEWWMFSIGAPYTSLRDAVEHAALTTNDPDVTDAIIQHMVELEIVNPSEIDVLPSYAITEVLIRYTDVGLYTLVQDVKRAMGSEPLTRKNFRSLRPGDLVTSYWWNGLHGCVGPFPDPQEVREVAEVHGDTVLAYYPHHFIRVVNAYTTKGCFETQSDRSRITWEEYSKTLGDSMFVAIQRRK